MTNWQSSVKREIYSGGKKKVCPTSSDESTRYQMPKWIRLNLRRILLTKPLFYWYWQKGLTFSDNWQSHNPLVTLLDSHRRVHWSKQGLVNALGNRNGTAWVSCFGNRMGKVVAHYFPPLGFDHPWSRRPTLEGIFQNSSWSPSGGQFPSRQRKKKRINIKINQF